MNSRQVYDVSPTQKKIIEEKYQRRLKLRHEYLQERLNPFKHALGGGGTVEDPALHRFAAHRATLYERFRPTWKNAAIHFGVIILPMVIGCYLLAYDRDRIELSRRRGEVSYRDREDKFV